MVLTDQNSKHLQIEDKISITLLINIKKCNIWKISNCSTQPRDRIFVKDYRYLSFAKNIDKYIGKNINKNLSNKYSQKLPDHAKKSATDATSSKRVILKEAEITSDLTGNKMANKIKRVPKNSYQNNWETVTNENYKEIPKGKYISPEERQEIIDELRLK